MIDITTLSREICNYYSSGSQPFFKCDTFLGNLFFGDTLAWQNATMFVFLSVLFYKMKSPDCLVAHFGVTRETQLFENHCTVGLKSRTRKIFI
jgi:hypothetical protein